MARNQLFKFIDMHSNDIAISLKRQLLNALGETYFVLFEIFIAIGRRCLTNKSRHVYMPHVRFFSTSS